MITTGRQPSKPAKPSVRIMCVKALTRWPRPTDNPTMTRPAQTNSTHTMTRGIAAAVLGVAVVASMGAVVAPPGAMARADATLGRQAELTTLDRKTVEQFLAELAETTKPNGQRASASPSATFSAQAVGLASLWHGRLTNTALDTLGDAPSTAPIREHLGDLSPPRA